MPVPVSPPVRRSLYFTGPHQVAVRTEACPTPAEGQVLVATTVSAVSAGTELLFYRNQVPPSLRADATITALADSGGYPLKYGYAAVGTIVAVGEGVDHRWSGRTVFAFNPHESHFIAEAGAVVAVPAGLSPDLAALLPNMETAVNFLMDAGPLIGERVLVVGLGIVGQLTCALLGRFPLAGLYAVDGVAARRMRAAKYGAATLSPDELATHAPLDVDLAIEVSGNPLALDSAIAQTGYDGRVIIGSWYGEKRAALDLGGAFHRKRTRLISSQVSTVAPAHSGRWDKRRRLDVAWSMLGTLQLDDLITHRFPIADAGEAYSQIDQRPADTLQVLFTYTDASGSTDDCTTRSHR